MIELREFNRGNGIIATYAVRDGKIVSANPLANPNRPALPVKIRMPSYR